MNPDAQSTSTPLEDYAVLRLDSPSVFAALLGTEEDGRWKLSILDRQVLSRRYLPRTFVLVTTWRRPSGVAAVTDFMPPSDGQADLVRRVQCLSGSAQIDHDLPIRFDHYRARPWTRRMDLHGTARNGLLSVATAAVCAPYPGAVPL
jgi:GH15 family glucan-1,4-alpha-glucosidase